MTNRADGILRNAKTAVPLQYLSTFWQSSQWESGNKIKWTKNCVLATAGVNNDNANSNSFPIKKRNLYVSVVTLSTKVNQKLSKIPIRYFERSVYLNEFKTKNLN